MDDIGLVIECDDLERGTRQFECIAKDAMQWGSAIQVEFEVSKTEVLPFSRRRKILQTADKVVVRSGEQSFAIKHDATKWLGFWLDPKLSYKRSVQKAAASICSERRQALRRPRRRLDRGRSAA